MKHEKFKHWKRFFEGLNVDPCKSKKKPTFLQVLGHAVEVSMQSRSKRILKLQVLAIEVALQILEIWSPCDIRSSLQIWPAWNLRPMKLKQSSAEKVRFWSGKSLAKHLKLKSNSLQKSWGWIFIQLKLTKWTRTVRISEVEVSPINPRSYNRAPWANRSARSCGTVKSQFQLSSPPLFAMEKCVVRTEVRCLSAKYPG